MIQTLTIVCMGLTVGGERERERGGGVENLITKPLIKDTPNKGHNRRNTSP